MWINILVTIGAIVVFVIGGLIGLRRLLFFTIVAIACFTVVAIVRGFYHFFVTGLKKVTSHQNAMVLTLLMLTLVPLFMVYQLGRRAMIKLRVTESVSPLVNATLGGGYLLAIYLVIIVVAERH
jgi:hypothetical protein